MKNNITSTLIAILICVFCVAPAAVGSILDIAALTVYGFTVHVFVGPLLSVAILDKLIDKCA